MLPYVQTITAKLEKALLKTTMAGLVLGKMVIL